MKKKFGIKEAMEETPLWDCKPPTKDELEAFIKQQGRLLNTPPMMDFYVSTVEEFRSYKSLFGNSANVRIIIKSIALKDELRELGEL